MAPTLIYLNGFEYQSLSTTAMPGGNVLWNTVQNAGVISFVTGRLQGLALRVAQDGVSISAAERSYGTRALIVVGFAFRVTGAPTTNAQLIRLPSTAGVHALLRVSTAGLLQAGYSDGTGNVGSTSVTDGGWHWVTMRVDATNNPNTIDWSLDGVAQTATSKAQAGTTTTGVRFGNSIATHDMAAEYDDAIFSVTTGDYPMQPATIYGYVPDRDGTHNLLAHVAGDAGETTNLYQKVDENPATTTDYIKQTVIDANAYAELRFPAGPEGTYLNARLISGGFSTTTTADNIHVQTLGGDDAVIKDSSLDPSDTTIFYEATTFTAAPTTGWNKAEFDALKVRIGYSSDITPEPRIAAIMLEFAVQPGPIAPGLISQAGATFAPQLNEQTVPGLISNPGSVFAPSQLGLSAAPALISNPGSVFAPSQLAQQLAPGLISQPGAVFTPQLNEQLVMALISQPPGIFTPTLTQSIAAGLISNPGSVFAPSQLAQQILMALISNPGATFSPNLSVGGGALTISPGLIDSSGVVFSPTLAQQLTPGLISQAGAVFAPQLTQAIVVGIISQAGAVFTPTLAESIAPGLISQLAATFAPQLNEQLVLALISNPGATFAPILKESITPGLISNPGAVFSPQLRSSISIALISQAGVVFTPALTQAIAASLIDQTALVYVIALFQAGAAVAFAEIAAQARGAEPAGQGRAGAGAPGARGAEQTPGGVTRDIASGASGPEV